MQIFTKKHSIPMVNKHTRKWYSISLAFGNDNPNPLIPTYKCLSICMTNAKCAFLLIHNQSMYRFTKFLKSHMMWFDSIIQGILGLITHLSKFCLFYIYVYSLTVNYVTSCTICKSIFIVNTYVCRCVCLHVCIYYKRQLRSDKRKLIRHWFTPHYFFGFTFLWFRLVIGP